MATPASAVAMPIATVSVTVRAVLRFAMRARRHRFTIRPAQDPPWSSAGVTS